LIRITSSPACVAAEERGDPGNADAGSAGKAASAQTTAAPMSIERFMIRTPCAAECGNHLGRVMRGTESTFACKVEFQGKGTRASGALRRRHVGVNHRKEMIAAKRPRRTQTPGPPRVGQRAGALPVVLGELEGLGIGAAPGLLGAGRLVVMPVVLEAVVSEGLDEKNNKPPRMTSAASASPAHIPALLLSPISLSIRFGSYGSIRLGS
jgi:hypothetical protein